MTSTRAWYSRVNRWRAEDAVKFVVDECTGPKVAKWLRQEGHDAISIFDDARGADDDRVLELAYNDSRVLVTSDKDFGELVFREKRPHHGIVLLRLIDQSAANSIAALERVFQAGHPLVDQFIVVTESGIRIANP
jgi:predicted nuclease of predicted toxin-antitoxin system